MSEHSYEMLVVGRAFAWLAALCKIRAIGGRRWYNICDAQRARWLESPGPIQPKRDHKAEIAALRAMGPGELEEGASDE